MNSIKEQILSWDWVYESNDIDIYLSDFARSSLGLYWHQVANSNDISVYVSVFIPVYDFLTIYEFD